MNDSMYETDGSYYFEDDLKGEPRRQAEAATQQAKCGTCQRFQVRPPEVELARAARSMGACGPAQYCFGGAVRGTCTFHGQQRESTQLCPFYKAGGPNGLNAVGSLSRASRGSANGGAPAPAPVEEGSGLTVGVIVTAVGLGALLGTILSHPPTSGGKGGSSARDKWALDDSDRGQWIDNDEGLYDAWKQSRKSKRAFIRENRDLIDGVIEAVRGGKKPAHYMAYPGPRGSGATRRAPR